MNKIYFFVLILFLQSACHFGQAENKKAQPPKTFSFDLQGHRGCRGLMPENSLPAFRKALELGVNTLEMDVVVTKDRQLLVSHDPWFSSLITTLKNGDTISAEVEKSYKIYQMDYKETQQYDCGKKTHPGFPQQEKMAVTKPLLRDVLKLIEEESKKLGKTICYNIEIKSMEKGDNIYHPTPEEFCPLVINLVQKYVPKDRFTIQSFDFRVLKYLHKHNPEITLSALVEHGSLADNLDSLGFVPSIYSPDHHLVDSTLVKEAHARNMIVIPWTINDPIVMRNLLEMGVDGIITDYPNRALALKKMDKKQ